MTKLIRTPKIFFTSILLSINFSLSVFPECHSVFPKSLLLHTHYLPYNKEEGALNLPPLVFVTVYTCQVLPLPKIRNDTQDREGVKVR